MQFSNGLSRPTGLWLGHLLFDTMFTVVIATAIVLVLGLTPTSDQFHGLGLFVSCHAYCLYLRRVSYHYQWLCIILYGICSALFAYLASLANLSPIGAVGLLALFQVVVFFVS